MSKTPFWHPQPHSSVAHNPRKVERWCKACGTWVRKKVQNHHCDTRKRTWRWCAMCSSYVLLSTKRHRCDEEYNAPEYISHSQKEKRCNLCREVLPLSCFYAKGPKGFEAFCKACKAERKAELAGAKKPKAPYYFKKGKSYHARRNR